ncbi:hypothetical protein D3C75_1036440 [compost metagenome]
MGIKLRKESIQPHLHHRIIVGEQDERQLAAGLPRLQRCLHAGAQMNIAAQGSGGSPLNNRAVGQRIGIRHTKLQDVRTRRLQLSDNIQRGLKVGIAYGKKRNQGRAALCSQLAEGQIHPVRCFGSHYFSAPSV